MCNNIVIWYYLKQMFSLNISKTKLGYIWCEGSSGKEWGWWADEKVHTKPKKSGPKPKMENLEAPKPMQQTKE